MWQYAGTSNTVHLLKPLVAFHLEATPCFTSLAMPGFFIVTSDIAMTSPARAFVHFYNFSSA